MAKGARRRLHPDKRREQLLACALQAYAENGVERAGHGEVAKLAGVSTATVFNYYSTREILTNAVFEDVRSTMRAIFIKENNSQVSRREIVMELGRKFDGFVDEYPSKASVFLNWSAAFGPNVRGQFLEFQDEMLNFIQKDLRSSREGRSDARIILGAAHVYTQMKLEKLPQDTLERFISRVAEVLNLD